MSLPPDQPIFLERAACGCRRLPDARDTIAPAGIERAMTKPFHNDGLRRTASEMLGCPQ